MNYFGFHRRMILTNALFEAHPKSYRARWKGEYAVYLQGFYKT